MSCTRFEDMLALHAGGDLAAEDVRPLKEHLAVCEGCRKNLEGIREALGVLRGAACTEEMLPEEDVSYWREVESKLRERALGVEKLSVGRAWWVRLPAVLAQAAVVLVVAGAVVWLAVYQARQTPEPTKGAVVKLAKRAAPTYVLVRTTDPYRQAEVSPLGGGSDVIYSDFNHVVYPREIRRFREQVVPASADGEVDGRF